MHELSGQPDRIEPFAWGDDALSAPQNPKQRRLLSKQILLVAADYYCQTNQIEASIRCWQNFCKLYGQHRFSLVPEWVAMQIRAVSWQSLRRWNIELKKNGVAAMIDHYGRNIGQNAIERNPELRQKIEGMLLSQPHLGTKQIYRAVQVRHQGAMPSYDIVRRWINAYKASPLGAALFTQANDPNEYRNKFEPAFGSRSERVKALNDLWELDSTLSDTIWELKDGKRYAIVGCIDVYSRRARLLVNPVSNSDAICALLRRCLIEWGVPQTVKTDNGKDYTSIRLSNLLKSLQVNHELCTPFTPQEKPHIERFLGTFNHSFVPYLEGFVGHNVAQRQAIRARERVADAPETMQLKVVSLDKSLKEFQEWCDKWCEWYLQEPHQGLGGKRPLDMIGGQAKAVISERALDVLLMVAPGGEGKRIVQKKGIAVGRLEDGKNAWHIGDWIAEPGVIGSTIFVRLDPAELGTIYVYRDPLGQEYLGRAHCPELTGLDRKVVAMQAKRVNKIVRKAVTARKRLVKEIAKTAAQEILDNAAAASGKVLHFPGTTTQHEVAATRVAEYVLKELEPRPAQPALTPERMAELQDYLQQPEEYETELNRFHRLRSLAPESLSREDFEWMRWYCSQPAARHIVAPALDYLPHLQVYLDGAEARSTG